MSELVEAGRFYAFTLTRPVMPGCGQLCYIALTARTFRDAEKLAESVPGYRRASGWTVRRLFPAATAGGRGIIRTKREGE